MCVCLISTALSPAVMHHRMSTITMVLTALSTGLSSIPIECSSHLTMCVCSCVCGLYYLLPPCMLEVGVTLLFLITYHHTGAAQRRYAACITACCRMHAATHPPAITSCAAFIYFITSCHEACRAYACGGITACTLPCACMPLLRTAKKNGKAAWRLAYYLQRRRRL